jgi:hypothetical protein
MAATGKDSSEAFQIAIFTCGFVAGGLALITLVLGFFMRPSAAEEVSAAEDDYRKLSTLLQDPVMQQLRGQAKLTEGKESKNNTLKEILYEKKGNFPAIDFNRLPETKPVLQANIEIVRQTVELKPAPMTPILHFMQTVREAKKTIQVEQVRFERDRRSKSDDSWVATVHFVDYVAK